MTLRSISRLGGMHALPATVLGLAACGGGTGNATATSTPSKSSSGRAATVGVANVRSASGGHG